MSHKWEDIFYGAFILFDLPFYFYGFDASFVFSLLFNVSFHSNSSIIHVYNLQACVLYLTIQKLSGECYVAETCSESFCCSVFYLSLRPLISFSFLFYPSIQVHPVIANTSCWFIVVPISTLCVSLSAEFNL